MTTNPEVLRLARELMALSYKTPEKRRRALSGIYDHEPEVRLAIAAIERTTELVQAEVLKMKQKFGSPIGTQYDEGQCDMAVRIYGRLHGKHNLRQSEKDNSDAS